MQSIEVKGKTVADAIRKGLEQLNLNEEQVSTEVIDEGDEGGFLGIGRRAAVVRLVVKENLNNSTEIKSELEEDSSVQDINDSYKFEQDSLKGEKEDKLDESNDEEAMTVASDFIRSILDLLHSEAEISSKIEGNYIKIAISGNDCGILIGRHGETLQAMQYLASLAMIKKVETKKRLQLDIGDYHKKRRAALVTLAKGTADRALKTGNAYELSPMKSSERRIVHEALQGYKGIVTYSEGDEPRRYVVIDLTEEYFNGNNEA